MPVRALLIFSVIICLAISGCKNEPYETFPLGVVSIVNHTPNTALTNATISYQYQRQKLYKFMSRTSTDTLSSMKLNFQHDVLKSIVSDSTKTSFKVTTFYNSGSPAVTDSTVLFEAGAATKVAARVVTYDGDGNPITISRTEWTATVTTTERADLTWEDGNVVHLVTSSVTTGKDPSATDITIAYDAQHGLYMDNREYLFTFALTELYWLSKNNPLTFTDEAGERSYVYSYNRLSYPSSFQTDTGATYGISYTQIR